MSVLKNCQICGRENSWQLIACVILGRQCLPCQQFVDINIIESLACYTLMVKGTVHTKAQCLLIGCKCCMIGRKCLMIDCRCWH